jgi:hypothetical protein
MNIDKKKVNIDPKKNMGQQGGFVNLLITNKL